MKTSKAREQKFDLDKNFTYLKSIKVICDKEAESLTVDGIIKGSSKWLGEVEPRIKSKERSISKSLEREERSNESSDNDFINRSRTLDNNEVSASQDKVY